MIARKSTIEKIKVTSNDGYNKGKHVATVAPAWDGVQVYIPEWSTSEASSWDVNDALEFGQALVEVATYVKEKVEVTKCGKERNE